MTLAEKLKQFREQRGMTQKQVAALMGISQQAYSQYESGTRLPKPETLGRLATALGVSPLDLVGDVELAVTAGFDTLDKMKKNGYTEYNPLENEDFSEIHIPMNTDPRLKKSWRRLMEAFSCLNLDGQEVAADRVEELAQIPKYQSERVHSGHMETPPGSVDDKEPDKK